MPILADHSTIVKLPTIRRVKGQSVASKLVMVTLPTLFGSYNISVGPIVTSDGTTQTTGGLSFDQTLTNNASAPSITTDGVDCDYMASGSTRCIPVPANPRYRVSKMFVWTDGANGYIPIRYHGDMSSVDK